jgi:peptidoglycan/xylan/chitin deacetylase (PgdA/CDA1 family)
MVNPATTLLLALVSRCIKGGGIIINEHALSPEQTRFHVEVLGRWFDFIKLEQLPGRLGQPSRRPFCLLTFDDGKRSNFSETAPELERLGVPAVFYVTTEPLSTGACLWFDRREQLVRALGHCPKGLELATLKQLPLELLMRRLDRVCCEARFQPEGGPDDLRSMTWDEARSLNQRGFTLGAHGLTHAILTREPREQAYAEIEESIARVSAETGAPCTTFAWPNGNYDAELAQHALRCGATTLMTTEPMWVNPRASLHRLPRIQLFSTSSRARIESKVALAAFKGLLPNPDGTGRAYCFVPGERHSPCPQVTFSGLGY